MEKLLDKKNSVIFRNPQEYYTDISSIFIHKVLVEKEPFKQINHGFSVGDAITYDASDNKFGLALAKNIKKVEVAGVVESIIDSDHFRVSTTGLVETNRYSAFPVGTQLYLSDINDGKLVSIAPANVVKPVAVCAENGIMIDIDTGWIFRDEESGDEVYEAYTKTELDEIIANIW